MPSFDETFAALYPLARGLAYRILGDMTAAEDAAAEALARALVRWNHVGRLPYRDGWVLRVTANVAIDMARRDARRSSTSPVEELEATGPEDATVPRYALVAALAELPRRQREAIVLTYLAGMSSTEAAKSMGVSVSSVSQHARRALTKLRGLLDDGAVETIEGGAR